MATSKERPSEESEFWKEMVEKSTEAPTIVPKEGESEFWRTMQQHREEQIQRDEAVAAQEAETLLEDALEHALEEAVTIESSNRPMTDDELEAADNEATIVMNMPREADEDAPTVVIDRSEIQGAENAPTILEDEDAETVYMHDSPTLVDADRQKLMEEAPTIQAVENVPRAEVSQDAETVYMHDSPTIQDAERVNWLDEAETVAYDEARTVPMTEADIAALLEQVPADPELAEKRQVVLDEAQRLQEEINFDDLDFSFSKMEIAGMLLALALGVPSKGYEVVREKAPVVAEKIAGGAKTVGKAGWSGAKTAGKVGYKGAGVMGKTAGVLGGVAAVGAGAFFTRLLTGWGKELKKQSDDFKQFRREFSAEYLEGIPIVGHWLKIGRERSMRKERERMEALRKAQAKDKKK